MIEQTRLLTLHAAHAMDTRGSQVARKQVKLHKVMATPHCLLTLKCLKGLLRAYAVLYPCVLRCVIIFLSCYRYLDCSDQSGSC